MSRYVVGITGASGSIYGVRLVEELLKKGHEVYFVITENGRKVLEYELEINFEAWIKECEERWKRITFCPNDDLFSEIASGSFRTDGMIIAPCSMGTLAKLSSGIADNLLVRAADVTIKVKRPLILVPRETPLSPIHLRNMLFLSELNVTILPPMPAFYHRPKTLEEIIEMSIGKILSMLNIQSDSYRSWRGREPIGQEK